MLTNDICLSRMTFKFFLPKCGVLLPYKSDMQFAVVGYAIFCVCLFPLREYVFFFLTFKYLLINPKIFRKVIENERRVLPFIGTELFLQVNQLQLVLWILSTRNFHQYFNGHFYKQKFFFLFLKECLHKKMWEKYLKRMALEP